MEEYRDIPGFEGLYAVSNYGNVWSHKRNRLLRTGPDGSQYLTVGLMKNSKRNAMRVHILVAMAFLDHIPDGTHKVVVDHRNNDRSNNNLSNLQLTTNRHNSSKDKVRKYGAHLPTGVYITPNKRFRSRIMIDKKQISLGVFDTPEEASAAYQTVVDKIAL